MSDLLFTLYRRGHEKPVVTFYSEDMDYAIDEAMEVIAATDIEVDAVADWCTFLTATLTGGGGVLEYQLVEEGHNLQPWED